MEDIILGGLSAVLSVASGIIRYRSSCSRVHMYAANVQQKSLLLLAIAFRLAFDVIGIPCGIFCFFTLKFVSAFLVSFILFVVSLAIRKYEECKWVIPKGMTVFDYLLLGMFFVFLGFHFHLFSWFWKSTLYCSVILFS